MKKLKAPAKRLELMGERRDVVGTAAGTTVTRDIFAAGSHEWIAERQRAVSRRCEEPPSGCEERSIGCEESSRQCEQLLGIDCNSVSTGPVVVSLLR